MKPLLLTGFIVFLAGLYLAFIQHSAIWYSFFVVGGFLLFEGINKQKGFSVLKHPKNFLLVWFYFALIGITVEIIGNYWLDMWDYPAYDAWKYILHVITIGYPFVGFFGLQLFVYLREKFSEKQLFILPIFAILFGYANEIPNLFAYEWVYKNWVFGDFIGIPILISLLWITILVSLLFERFFQPKLGTKNPLLPTI